MDSPPLTTSDFDYRLPEELIAQTPPAVRGESRLLVVTRTEAAPGAARPVGPSGAEAASPAERFDDRRFGEIVEVIPPGDLVVLNSTKVRRARLIGRRPSGAPAEVLLIHPSTDGTWIAMGKPGSALRPGKGIALGDATIETVEVLDGPNRRVRFVGITADLAMERYGMLPLPPYIDHPATALDQERYQTVYADREGSVAAPTAGLHFTHEILAELRRRGVTIATLDLEVGPGTFRPVEVEDPRTHPMHEERFDISADLAGHFAETRQRGGRVWAVGTTVVRALESSFVADGRLRPGPGVTSLLILPGYRFGAVDRLITNFHLPRSTLLMLVSAFGGVERIRQAYRHAVAERYRFFSYGDAMVVR